MMIVLKGFLLAALVVGWLAALIWMLSKSVYDGPWLWGVAAWAILTLGAVFSAGIISSREGPCLKYDEVMAYNAATKTMMPARVCVQRGEWVDG